MMSLLSIGSILKFIQSPLGMMMVGVIALMAWTSYQRHDAARDARTACEQKHQAATLKEIARQDQVVADVLDKALADKKRIDEELNRLEEMTNAIHSNSNGACILDDATIKRLSDIK